MIGAIAGDIIGSIYETFPIRTKDFPLFSPECRFTDDSVLTVAVAHAILNKKPYVESIRSIGRKYPHCGYGGYFLQWLFTRDYRPYNSWGNGSAMRVSPVGFAFDSAEGVLDEARKSAEITHDHPEGIRGAQATALAVFLARTTRDKVVIKKEIADRFGYELNRSFADVHNRYKPDVSCQGTVPEAIISFLEADSYEDTVRNAISLGGDSDTLACIAGGIAAAFYGGVPPAIIEKVREILTDELWRITVEFCNVYGINLSA